MANNAKQAVGYALHDTFGFNQKHHEEENIEKFMQHLRREGFTVTSSALISESWFAGFNAGRDTTYDEEGYPDD
jgi:hypothetical protein